MKISITVLATILIVIIGWFGIIDRDYYYRIHWKGAIIESSFSLYCWPITTKLLNHCGVRSTNSGELRIYLDKPTIDSDLISEQAIVYADAIKRTAGKCAPETYNSYCEYTNHGRNWTIRVGIEGEYIVDYIDGTKFHTIDDIYVK